MLLCSIRVGGATGWTRAGSLGVYLGLYIA